MPSVIKRGIFRWWAINDSVIVRKIDYPIMAYAEIDNIFPPSFLMLWFWSSKRPIPSPPKLFWVPFTSLSDVPSDSWLLVRWRIGIELAQSGSLGSDHPCHTLARLAEWRGVSEEGTLGQAHLTLLKGIHDPVTLLSGGEHNQEREVVMSGSFLDLELC